MANRFNLKGSNILEIDGDLWFFNLYFNGLIRIDRATGRIKQIYRSPHLFFVGRFAYSDMHIYGNYIYLIPNMATEVAIFDMVEESYSYLQLERRYVTKNRNTSLCAYRKGKLLYIIPALYKAFAILNMEKQEITYHTDGIEEFLRERVGRIMFRDNFVIRRDSLYLPVSYGEGIGVFNIETGEISRKKPEGISNCATIDYVSPNFFLASSSEDALYIWNEETGKVRKCGPFGLVSYSSNYYAFSCVMGRRIILFPHDGDRIICWEIDNEVWRSYPVPSALGKDRLMTYMVKKRNEQFVIWLAGQEEPHILRMEGSMHCMEPIIRFDKEYNNHRIAAHFLENKVYKYAAEKKDFLTDFLEFISYL